MANQSVAATTRDRPSALGAELRAIRRERGIKQQDLAAQAGISRSYLCDIERGRVSNPSLQVLDGLAASLGIARLDLLQAAGVVESAESGAADHRLQRLVAVFRDLSEEGQRSVDRFAHFVHAEEHRWVQTSIEGPGGRDRTPTIQEMPTLFDASDPDSV